MSIFLLNFIGTPRGLLGKILYSAQLVNSTNKHPNYIEIGQTLGKSRA